MLKGCLLRVTCLSLEWQFRYHDRFKCMTIFISLIFYLKYPGDREKEDTKQQPIILEVDVVDKQEANIKQHDEGEDEARTCVSTRLSFHWLCIDAGFAIPGKKFCYAHTFSKSLRKNSTINKVTIMLTTSKTVLLPGHNHLLNQRY